MFSGEAARDAGIEQVLDHLPPHWHTAYGVTLVFWFTQLTIGTEFSGEDMTRHARPLIGEPHHPNAWGAAASALLRDWLNAGRIVVVGQAVSRSAANHAHVYRRYRKVTL